MYSVRTNLDLLGSDIYLNKKKGHKQEPRKTESCKCSTTQTCWVLVLKLLALSRSRYYLCSGSSRAEYVVLQCWSVRMADARQHATTAVARKPVGGCVFIVI